MPPLPDNLIGPIFAAFIIGLAAFNEIIHANSLWINAFNIYLADNAVQFLIFCAKLLLILDNPDTNLAIVNALHLILESNANCFFFACFKYLMNNPAACDYFTPEIIIKTTLIPTPECVREIFAGIKIAGTFDEGYGSKYLDDIKSVYEVHKPSLGVRLPQVETQTTIGDRKDVVKTSIGTIPPIELLPIILSPRYNVFIYTGAVLTLIFIGISNIWSAV